MDFMLSNTAKQKPTQRNVIQWRPGFLNSIVDTTVSKTKDTVKKLDRSWETVVNIVLVEAKCLPPVPDDGVSHTLSCKLRLGSESCRSKSVPSSQNPQWKERFRLHLYQNWVLNISLRDEGKMKNPMGSCVLDLSKYEKERTHEIWQQLDDGYGAIHVSVTMCAICSPDNTSNSFVDLRECVISHDYRSAVLWAIPLLLLIPFLYQWIFGKNQDNVSIVQDCANDDENKEEKTVGGRIQDLQTMTLTITNGIDFIVSYKERLLNLFTFKVPFLSVIAMILLLVSSVGLYFIPINYFLMSLGIYKFGRKYSNPDRVLNNGLIDFLSRVPDSRKLKDWKELGVPEPNQEYQRQSFKIFRSISTPNLR
ncbi:jg969 [Pararge aegeria aegeria]|uniref:Jg969 protein n=1 Tax=Pararge aegeria aegeria TaxID=348720 RepID=A0A8S4S9M4_9NEOP|nr:jg969 [Pararge aegeria aegeria]